MWPWSTIRNLRAACDAYAKAILAYEEAINRQQVELEKLMRNNKRDTKTGRFTKRT